MEIAAVYVEGQNEEELGGLREFRDEMCHIFESFHSVSEDGRSIIFDGRVDDYHESIRRALAQVV